MVIFLDTNVVFDYFDDREFSGEAEKIFEFCSDEDNTGVIASLSFSTFFYVFRKILTVTERKEDIKMLSELFTIASVDRQTILRALQLKMDDYEDAIQVSCAEQNNASVVITNNEKDFQQSPIPVMSSKEFVEKYCDS